MSNYELLSPIIIFELVNALMTSKWFHDETFIDHNVLTILID